MKTEYIPSGEYYISSKEHSLLKILLGSCVGVAIYDKDAKIGGVIHLLLPESVGSDGSWQPYCFAEYGLPLFIGKLVEAGADKSKMAAVIAGGALFGHISKQDINLNIGGRTIERVLKILSHEKIPVVQEQTGGFLPTVMQVNTQTWQIEIHSNYDQSDQDVIEFTKPSEADINNAINNISPIPQAAIKVINLINDGEYHMGEISETLLSDQVLGAKILSLCNSALFGSTREISSLQEALLILGEGYLIEAVVSAAIDSFFSQKRGGYSMLRGGLYRHAIAVAHTAKIIAIESGRCEPGTAYTAGLLHDIGKVVLDQYFALIRPEFYRQNFSDLTKIESSLLGINHQQAGRKLAEDWHLPLPIISTIAGHHHPDLSGKHFEPIIVYLADVIASWFLSGMEYDIITPTHIIPSLEAIGLESSDLSKIVEKVPWDKLMYI